MRELLWSKQLLEDEQPFQSVTVSITKEAINNNILMAYEIFKKYTQCFDTTFEMLALHSNDNQTLKPLSKTTTTSGTSTPEPKEIAKEATEARQHRASLLLLSLIDWSPRPSLDSQVNTCIYIQKELSTICMDILLVDFFKVYVMIIHLISPSLLSLSLCIHHIMRSTNCRR